VSFVLLFCCPTRLSVLNFSSATWLFSAQSHLVTPESSRAPTPVDDMEAFDPSRPSLNPGDSVLLPLGNVAGYLDAALKALALHTEARASFITYVSALLVITYSMSGLGS